MLNSIKLLIKLFCSPLDVIKSIKCVHELHHGLRVLLVLIWVTLDEERQRQVVEDVLVKLILRIIRQVEEQFGLFGDAAVAFKMVHELLLARVHIRLDLFTECVELEPVARRLPPEVVVRVTRSRLQPEFFATLHGCPDERRIVAGHDGVAKFVWIERRSLLDGLRTQLCLAVEVTEAYRRVKVHHTLSIVVFGSLSMLLMRAAYGDGTVRNAVNAWIVATASQVSHGSLLIVEVHLRRELMLTHELLRLRDQLFGLLVEHTADVVQL